LAVYDFLAVRFGYMVWMANRLSESDSLPAFVLPRRASDWSSSVKQYGITKLADEAPAARKFSILGGGDIGIPLLLVAAVYFASGFGSAIFIAAFTLLGLIGAYWIQARFLKGKAMPALPPIAVMSLIGLLIIR
jgi:presenilin-like A22 family membrane protease